MNLKVMPKIHLNGSCTKAPNMKEGHYLIEGYRYYLSKDLLHAVDNTKIHPKGEYEYTYLTEKEHLELIRKEKIEELNEIISTTPLKDLAEIIADSYIMIKNQSTEK